VEVAGGRSRAGNPKAQIPNPTSQGAAKRLGIFFG
jgi:hypothetical protein